MGKPEVNPGKTHGTAVPDSSRVPEEEEYRYDTSTHESMTLRTEALESTLDEELSLLSREYRDLGDEQRKLERNAESVNNEMFAECQVILFVILSIQIPENGITIPAALNPL